MLRPLRLALAVLALAAVTPYAAAQTTDSTTAGVPALSADVPMASDTTAAEFVANPAMARPLYEEGITLARAGSYEAALLKYEESLLHDGGFVASLLGRAQALAQLGRLEDARTAYEASIAAARSAEDSRVLTVAERGLEQVQTALSQRAAAAEAAEAASAAASAAATMQENIDQAVELLGADPVEPAAAQQAYDALERAREAGYDANLVAFYYAKALLALDRGAEAVAYAQTAVDAADAASDRSALYVQLGLAQRAAGDTDAARASFEAAREGSWSGWAEHYLRELDAPSE